MYVAHVMSKEQYSNLADEPFDYTNTVVNYQSISKFYFQFFETIGIERKDFNRVSWGFSSVVTEGNLLVFHGSDMKDNVLLICNVDDEDILHHHAYYDYTDWLFYQEHKHYENVNDLISAPECIMPCIKANMLSYQDDEVLFRLRKSQIVASYDSYAEFLKGKYAWCIAKHFNV